MRWKRFAHSAQIRLAPRRQPRAGVSRRRRPAPGRERGERAAVLHALRVRRVRRTRRTDAWNQPPREAGRAAANDVTLHDSGDGAALRDAHTVGGAGRLKRPRRRTATHTPVLRHVSFFYATPPVSVSLLAGDGTARRAKKTGEQRRHRSGKRRGAAGLRLAA
ncbi:hypothetical protein [Burkholderia latens]|uniref:Uncharacterized protein n=1 Tax=Burkholderia latens TaxID=488446 RepID=A0A6H9T177_9BURK|nr:hypothetical protein [Burkholderia latens]KAB0642727.1 hypothetical protein F7R21_10545 [Burkholderia latens]